MCPLACLSAEMLRVMMSWVTSIEMQETFSVNDPNFDQPTASDHSVLLLGLHKPLYNTQDGRTDSNAANYEAWKATCSPRCRALWRRGASTSSPTRPAPAREHRSSPQTAGRIRQ